MLIATLRTAVRRKWQHTIPTTEFVELVAAAVREYSRWNPRVAETTVTTVADQQYYDLPSGCIGVQEAFWFPIGQPYTEYRATQELTFMLRQPGVYYLPSQRVIEDIDEEAHIEALRGNWEYLSGQGQIRITPEPSTSGTEITVRYYASHTLNDGETGYDTVPDADLEIVRDLVLAEVLKAELMEVSVQPDYAEGLERETFHFVPPNLAQVISDLQRGVRLKYGGGVALVSPP